MLDWMSGLPLVALFLVTPAPLVDGWSELPVPSIAEPSPAELWTETELPLGSRIGLDDARPATRGPERAFRMPLASLMELLEVDSRRAGDELRCLRIAPPLLVRGSDAAIARARTVVADLDRVGRAQRIRIRVELAASGSSDAIFRRSAELRSGEPLRVGARESQTFLADFDVDVATGTGTADPRMGEVVSGPVAELRAWRSPVSGAVFVSGSLDIAELAALDVVDTGSPELGRLQRPRVTGTRVHFSGLLPAGGELSVEIRGAPLSLPDWNLVIQADVLAEKPSEWRVLDLAWLSSDVAELFMPAPGAGLRTPVAQGLREGRLEPLTSSIVWTELEAALPQRSADRPPFVVAPGIFAAPADAEQVWAELELLIGAASRARSTTRRVTLQRGDFRVVFPTAIGIPFAVQVGEERTVLSDYDIDLAPEYWMAQPEVERAFDGLLVQGRMGSGELSATWWSSTSAESDVLSRNDTLHGRLETTRRTLESGSIRATPGATRAAGPFTLELGSEGHQ